jgi:hypothetical protein
VDQVAGLLYNDQTITGAKSIGQRSIDRCVTVPAEGNPLTDL